MSKTKTRASRSALIPLVFILLITCADHVRAQIISTYAGNGTHGMTGDGGPATAAEMGGPWGIATDTSGNLYFCDFDYSRIRMVAVATGTISTICGTGGYGYSGDGGPATAATMTHPTDVKAYGNDVYFMDVYNCRVRKISGGIVTTVVGTGTCGYTGDGGQATAARINSDNGLALDASGNIYITEQSADVIRKVNASTGIITTIAGTAYSGGYTGDGGPASLAKLNLPNCIYLDGSGNIYFSDNINAAVRRIDASTMTITTVAGSGVTGYSGDGGPGTAAKLHNPGGVDVDIAGNLYIGDATNNVVRIVNTTGTINTWAGTGTAGFSGDGGLCSLAKLNYPDGVAHDKCGNEFIGDISNYRIRKVTASISGPSVVCVSSTITLLCGALGGTWSSSSTSTATVGSGTGVVTGVATGTVTISYTLPSNCGSTIVTYPVTVNAAPSLFTVTGGGAYCSGGTGVTIGLSGSSTGVTYQLYRGTSTVGSVVSGTGSALSFGLQTTAGTYTVIGTSAACGSTTMTGSASIVINPLPTPYALYFGSPGVDSICANVTGTHLILSNSQVGVNYQLLLGGIPVGSAFVGIGSALDLGVMTTPGVYSVVGTNIATSCVNIMGSATVLRAPGPITGTSAVCAGSSITLSDTTAGGTWSVSNTHASVGTTGVMTGITPGNDTVSYRISTGCTATKVVLVNPSVLLTCTPGSLCTGAISTLCTPSYTGGVWTTTPVMVATVNPVSGVVTVLSPGTFTLSYVLVTGCMATSIYTVYPTPSPISGYSTFCPGVTVTLTDTTLGGTWTSSNPTVATVTPSTGMVTGLIIGTATISYTMPTGCYAVFPVTVAGASLPIGGPPTVCVGSNITLTSGITGGSWSSSNTGIAIVGSTGIVTGMSAGPVTISYTLPTCYYTKAITVNPGPSPITGLSVVCTGSSTSEFSSPPGGTWSATNGDATVGSAGSVTGVTPGIDTVVYTLSNGCNVSHIMTVNITPVISAPPSVCLGSFAVAYCSSGSGMWSGAGTFLAVGSTTGIVSGIALGTGSLCYTMSTTGCSSCVTMSVNPVPGPISGASSVCIGNTTLFTDGTSGGVWTSSSANATVNSTTGSVTGVSFGTATISYTLPGGCYATKNITVNTSPGAITGLLSICAGDTTTLHDLATGGTWTLGATGTATIVSSTGLLTGVTSGTVTVSYHVTSGCVATAVETVNPLPTIFTVTGGGSYCAGGTGVHIGMLGSSAGVTYQLFDGITPAGGPITGTGLPLDFGLQTMAGTYTVIATDPVTGCRNNMSGSVVITINPLPAAISGASAVCAGATIALTDSTPGGAWGDPGYSSIATIGTSGVVTGVATGTAAITYTLPTGCYTTKIVTVSPGPTTISGASTVCTGTSVTWTDGTPGGIWSSPGYTSYVSVGSSSGSVTGVAAGTAIITYSLGAGCTVTKSITVSTSPAPITGTLSLCPAGSTVLGDLTSGGVWSSSSPTVASIGSSSGVVLSYVAGTTNISYTLASGCRATATVTVNTGAGPIGGVSAICVGTSTTLTDLSSGGTWSSTYVLVAPIGSTSGIATGVAAGVTTITYTVGAGCYAVKSFTVYPLPSSITGASAVCIGTTTTLGDATSGGAWSSSGTTVATIGSLSGTVSGISSGTVTISYTLGTGCTVTRTETVNSLPPAITGIMSVCQGQTTLLSDAAGGGTWSSASTGVATVGSTGLVTGVTSGTAAISYTIGTGCAVGTVVTVNALPPAISGSGTVCVGSVTTWTDALPGGTWSSGATGVAIVGSSTGAVGGVGSGTAIITYSPASGCSTTKTITVNAVPAGITGSPVVCVGTSTLLNDVTSGGVWSSSNTFLATVGSSTGYVTGVSTGTVTISYTAGGCFATVPLIIHAAPPAITGATNVCAGNTITLTDASPGGIWASSNTAIAIVGSSSGIVTGLLSGPGGLVTISYSTSAGCVTSHVVSVTVVPPITGVRNICAWGDTFSVNDANPSGIYTSSLATVTNLGGGNGIASSAGPGTASIIYTLPGGCYTMATLTIYPLPAMITGVMNICPGTTTTLYDATPGGTWSSGTPVVAAVGSSTGMVAGMSSGIARITYTLPTGCIADTLVHVNTPPSAILGVTSMVIGTSTTFTDATPGGAWSSTAPAVATIGSSSGLAHGVTVGTTILSYTLTSTGCAATKLLSVNLLPPTGGSTPEGTEVISAGGVDIRVMPNPNSGAFVIKGSLGDKFKDDDVTIEVTDMLGKTIFRKEIAAQNSAIDDQVSLPNGIANGMYLLSLRTGSYAKVMHIVVQQ